MIEHITDQDTEDDVIRLRDKAELAFLKIRHSLKPNQPRPFTDFYVTHLKHIENYVNTLETIVKGFIKNETQQTEA